MIILSPILKKILLSLIPFLVMYFLKSNEKKSANKKPFIIDKNNVKEGEIVGN